VLRWSSPAGEYTSLFHLSRLAPVEPRQNSPPVYLACLTLLL
jgi:hypothetical protein